MRRVIDDGFISMLEGRDLCIRQHLDGLFGGNRRSDSYGSSAEFADYRPYIPGDDLRRIDWNLYGRFDKLYLRLFTDERQQHHRIYLDTSASMDWGEPNKADWMLKLAASLGFLGIQAMDRVSFYAIRGGSCVDLCRSVMGREAFYQAAETLNHLSFYEESDLGTAIFEAEDIGKKDGLSIIISDFLTDSDWKKAVDRLLSVGREVLLIQVLSEDELDPLLNGKVFLMDAEAEHDEDDRNERMEITRDSFRAYAKALAWHQKELQTFCASRNVTFLSFCSKIPTEKLLFEKFAEAGLII